jgi:hypothetical protein
MSEKAPILEQIDEPSTYVEDAQEARQLADEEEELREAVRILTESVKRRNLRRKGHVSSYIPTRDEFDEE